MVPVLKLVLEMQNIVATILKQNITTVLKQDIINSTKTKYITTVIKS